MGKMKKIALIMILVLLLSFGLVKAEDDWKINSYYYGHSGASLTSTDLDLYFNLTYPEGRPHFYEPNPGWNPGYYKATEMAFLETPYFEDNISGTIKTGYIVFDLDRNYPSEGEYNLSITESNGKLVHLFGLNFEHDLFINITEAKWLCGDKLSYTKSNPLKIENIGSICGINLELKINNTGDFPYFLGFSSVGEINLQNLFNLSKGNNNAPIYQWDLTGINRQDIEFFDLESPDEMYIPVNGEIICDLNIFFDEYSFELSNYGSGDYRIGGYVQTNYENKTYDIKWNATLTIAAEEGIPGFELAILLFSIVLVLFLKYKKKR